MNTRRLTWEPESGVSTEELEAIVMKLTNGRGNVSILMNGTLLFVKKSTNDEALAKEFAEAASSLRNFKVVPVDVGGYLVGFGEAVAVFVSNTEFEQYREEILQRLGDLCFPGEKFTMPHDAPEDHALVGIYGRGKLQRDAHNFRFYKRV